MRMTERVKEIIRMNSTNHYIPLVIHSDQARMFPMYFARIHGENRVDFPVTDGTGIDDVLNEITPASAMVVDRPGGYEAYLLKGKVRHETSETDYDLTMEMRNAAPGFPVHGAVVFEIESVHLLPPP